MRENSVECHAIEIIQDDQVLLKKAFAPYKVSDVFPCFSITKSFTGIAIGYLITEGKLKLDDTWLSYFPEYRKSATANFEKVTIKNLLTMTSGQDSEPIIFKESDCIPIIIGKPLAYMPSKTFCYNSMSSHLLSCLVQKITHETEQDYLDRKLFKKLNIRNYHWDTDRNERTLGGFGLHMKISDLASFGKCLMNDGRFNGKQVIPEQWIKQATHIQVVTKSQYPKTESENTQGYGYQFWRSTHDSYRCSGQNGQLCFINPENRLVVAMFSGTTGSKAILDCLFDAFENSNSLKKAKYSIPLLKGKENSELFEITKTVTKYSAYPNYAGVKSISVAKTKEKTLNFTIYKNDSRYTFEAGYGEWKPNEDEFSDFSPLYWNKMIKNDGNDNDNIIIYANYAWNSPTSLQIQLRASNCSAEWSIKVCVEKETLLMQYSVRALYTQLPEFEVLLRKS